jgi:pimeloyl-ACP methyl ester carboxylesterase
MGGYVTLAACKLAPERFLALGLIASQAGADTEEGRQGRYKMAEKVAAEGSKVVAEVMIPKLFAPQLPAASIIEQVRQMILNTQPAGIIGALKGMAVRPDFGPMLPNLRIPVLVLAGDQDQIIPPAKAKAMAAAVRTATLTTVANAGHMPMLEQPEATTTAIRDFLSAAGASKMEAP